jgi:hypothetical protein
MKSVERRRGRGEFEVLESSVWSVDWATRISKVHTAFVKCMYMEGDHHGIWVKGEESKVLGANKCHMWTVGWATGISKACVAFVKCTYMEEGRRRSERACEEGEESKVLGADGRRARAMGWATGISKEYTELVRRTYMEGGPNGV